MKIGIICGNHRTNAGSQKAMDYIAREVESITKVSPYLLDLAEADIPFWDAQVWSEGLDWNKQWKNASDNLQVCDGLIIITPEYGGMVPPRLKNFFLLCSRGELMHKPGLIVSVSSGINGAYPVAELRSSSYKNNKICYIPEHIIIRNIEEVLGNTASSERDISLRDRINHSLDILISYSKGLKEVRSKSDFRGQEYKYGM